MVFKCTSCGSCMVYNFEKKTLECPSCGSINTPELHADNKDNPDVCPICGGALELGKYGSAKKCGYCDSYVVSDARTSGQYQPQYIIPSTMTKKTMFQLLDSKFAKYMCIIPEIFSENRLKEVIIEYVPYWVYTFGLRATYTDEIKTSKEVGDRTRIDSYHIEKVIDVKMGDVPVDASDRMPDGVMDELEPFDFTAQTEFRQEYLSGSNSEIYNHESDAYREEAALKASAKTYEYVMDKVREEYEDSTDVNLGSVSSHTALDVTTLQNDYYLLPVYRYSYKFKSGRTLDYYVNGQTKEICGDVPISRRRLATACAAVLTAFAGAAALVVTFMMIIGGAL